MPLNQINILLSYYHEPKTTDRGVYTAKPEINNNKPFSLTSSTVVCQNSHAADVWLGKDLFISKMISFVKL